MIDAPDRLPIVRRSPTNRPVVAQPIANRLTLFGGAAVATTAGPLSGRAAQRHRVALLALLATTRRLYRSRDQLIFLLWPDADAERGRKLLSDSIYRINQALGGDVITGTGEDLRLNRNQLGGDVADLESAVDARQWRDVADLYAGPFLDGFFLPGAAEFDQWMEKERAQYARAAAKAVEALAVDARDAGRAAESVDWWQRLASLVPDDSRVAMELMRALETSGNRAAAVRHAQMHGTLLRETIGVEPDRIVLDLADRIATRCDMTAVASTPAITIAVLPFKNSSGSPVDDCVADGLSEEVTFALTKTPGLRVASPTSSFAYHDLKLDVREVARRLQVSWILEGSVRRAGESLRIVARLTDASTGYQVWSESFDRPSGDVFAIQAEIACAIADRLPPAMNGGSVSHSASAARTLLSAG
jgi:TolB-like protein